MLKIRFLTKVHSPEMMPPTGIQIQIFNVEVRGKEKKLEGGGGGSMKGDGSGGG